VTTRAGTDSSASLRLAQAARKTGSPALDGALTDADTPFDEAQGARLIAQAACTTSRMETRQISPKLSKFFRGFSRDEGPSLSGS
jgi:hypothetical protein